MSLIVTTPPTVEPLSLAEAKDHLRVDITDDDALIWDLIRAARQTLEAQYRRSLAVQTLTMGLDYFWQPTASQRIWPVVVGSGGPWGYDWMYARWAVLELQPPVVSVTDVSYVAPDGTTQTLTSSFWGVDVGSEPGRLYPKIGNTWPVAAPVPGAVQITFVSGYTPVNYPRDIKSAQKLILGNLYENREEIVQTKGAGNLRQLPKGVEALMTPYNVANIQ